MSLETWREWICSRKKKRTMEPEIMKAAESYLRLFINLQLTKEETSLDSTQRRQHPRAPSKQNSAHENVQLPLDPSGSPLPTPEPWAGHLAGKDGTMHIHPCCMRCSLRRRDLDKKSHIYPSVLKEPRPMRHPGLPSMGKRKEQKECPGFLQQFVLWANFSF